MTLDLVDWITELHHFADCTSCEVRMITEPKNSEDVFEHGCERMKLKKINCTVSTSTLHEDFMEMLTSDIFVMSPSSLSFWASILGMHSNVYLVPGTKTTHWVFAPYLSFNNTDFSSVHLNQMCFAYSEKILSPIECSIEEVVKTFDERFQKHIFQRFSS